MEDIFSNVGKPFIKHPINFVTTYNQTTPKKECTKTTLAVAREEQLIDLKYIYRNNEANA